MDELCERRGDKAEIRLTIVDTPNQTILRTTE